MTKLTRTELAVLLLTLLFLAFLGGYRLGHTDPTVTILQPGAAVREESEAVPEQPNDTEPADAVSSTPDEKIDINHATAEELATLPGIGEVLAERIIAYREAHNGFASVEEIMDVSGIGEKKFTQISALITLEGGTT